MLGMERSSLVALAAGVFALAAGAHAQSATSMGSLAGTVVDGKTEAPLANAVVIARGAALLGEQSVTTDEAGHFEITLLPAASNYSISVQHDGYPGFTAEGVVVKEKRLAKVKIGVLPAPQAVSLEQQTVEFTDAMTVPSMVSGPNPEYTQDAVDRGVQGTIVVRCIVTSEGSVRKCKAQNHLPFMDAAVIDALERRKYRPATMQGKPLDVFYTFRIKLALPSER